MGLQLSRIGCKSDNLRSVRGVETILFIKGLIAEILGKTSGHINKELSVSGIRKKRKQEERRG
jgi:hypothetical protein